MWTTVLVLAVAVNFEPARIGLLPLLLARERPMRQLLAFLIGGLTVSLTFSFQILFVLRRSPFGTNASNGGMAQIVLGSIVLVGAAIMVVRWRWPAVSPSGMTPVPKHKAARALDSLSTFVSAILRKGRSPWVAGLLGAGSGMPSIDSLAVLVVIAGSHKSPAEQAAALLTWVLLGSLVMMAPLVGHMMAPTKTLDAIGRLGTWTRSRSQIEYAGLPGLVGLLMIGAGSSHL